MGRLRVALCNRRVYGGPRFRRGPFSLDTANIWLGINETQAVIGAAATAAAFALWGIFSQRDITARQTTIQYIRDGERDHDMEGSIRLFHELARKPEGLAKWAAEEHSQSDETRAIRMVLNEYELVAIGIERGILDDITYRRWHRSAVIRNWRLAAPYVFAVRSRTGNDALFHEF